MKLLRSYYPDKFENSTKKLIIYLCYLTITLDIPHWVIVHQSLSTQSMKNLLISSAFPIEMMAPLSFYNPEEGHQEDWYRQHRGCLGVSCISQNLA